MDTLPTRFWSKVQRGAPDECWLWLGAKLPRGYGYIGLGGRYGKKVLAHRQSCEWAHGPIPEGYEVDHLCGVPSCVNPAHLEAVTPRTNKLRSNSFAGLKARQTHCLRGHEFNEENTAIRTNGTRKCRACDRASAKVKYQRRVATR